MSAYWTLVIAISLCCLLWAIVGYLLCQATHKQRGIEADRPVTDNLPVPPKPVVVPDTVPDEWTEEVDA